MARTPASQEVSPRGLSLFPSLSVASRDESCAFDVPPFVVEDVARMLFDVGREAKQRADLHVGSRHRWFESAFDHGSNDSKSVALWFLRR